MFNPFGFWEALLALLDIHSIASSRKKPVSKAQERFELFWYFLALLLGLGFIVWMTVRLYS